MTENHSRALNDNNCSGAVVTVNNIEKEGSESAGLDGHVNVAVLLWRCV